MSSVLHWNRFSQKKLSKNQKNKLIAEFEKEMKATAKLFEFEHVALLRGKIEELKK